MNDAIVMEESPVNMSEIIDLKSRIKVKRGLFTRDWVDVKVYEFTPSIASLKQMKFSIFRRLFHYHFNYCWMLMISLLKS